MYLLVLTTACRERFCETTGLQSPTFEVIPLPFWLKVMSCTDVFSLVGTARSYDRCWHMFSSCPDGYSLVCGLPRAPTSKASNRPLGSVDAAALPAVGLRKKLLALNAAFNVLRHVNSVRAERLLAELDAEVHVKRLILPVTQCTLTPRPAPRLLHQHL